ncbi:MAG: PcfB family protein [Clostridia bacterium]
MQEDIDHRAVTLVVNTAKMTTRVLKNAILKYLAHCKQKSRASHSITGKQTVKQLVGQGQGVTNIEITDQNIKSFERVARKYGVDYALKKDISRGKPRYLVFFKAKDTDALTAAFKEFTAKTLKREEKPSVLEQFTKLKTMGKPLVHGKTKEKAR